MENLVGVRALIALGQEMLGNPGATLSFHLREVVTSGLLSVERESRILIQQLR